VLFDNGWLLGGTLELIHLWPPWSIRMRNIVPHTCWTTVSTSGLRICVFLSH